MQYTLLLSILLVSSLSFADGSNVTNQYLQIGTIDQSELIQEYRDDEVKYPDQIEILNERIKNAADLPPNVKFMKMVEYPDYSPDAAMLLHSRAARAPDICLNEAYQPPSSYRLPMDISPLDQGTLNTRLGRQCGVIYVRNSWGNRSYNGNYLMTYDYYNTFAKNHSPQFYALPNMAKNRTTLPAIISGAK